MFGTDEAEQRSCSFLCLYFGPLPLNPPLFARMGSLVGAGALSSCFSGPGSQREALAVGSSRWSLWEPVFVDLGRCRSGMCSDLYLAPVPFIASICQGLTP